MELPYYRLKGGICAPRAFLGGALSCGIKNPDSDRLDLALVYSTEPCISVGTFTTNRVKAAPVRVSQAHLRANPVRAVIANSGNANACTGPNGITDAKAMARGVAKPLGLNRREVAVCSTGVIGLPMPMARIEPHYADLVEKLGPKNGNDVARAIITSDTHEKEAAISFELGGERIRIGGCVKGAGMIAPSMATMLCFITTDANISPFCLDRAVKHSVDQTFNRICIDGDMSTNDTVLVLANGAAKNKMIRRNSKNCEAFTEALQFLMNKLAKALVRDGERVTKFVILKVKGARTHLDAKKACEAVAKSALVKASWNGNDPNWGRVIHAVGYSKASIREELIDICYDDTPACLGGLRASTDPDKLREIVAKSDFEITINLNLGQSDYHMYSSDLSPEYIDFNRSEYAYWKQSRKDGLI